MRFARTRCILALAMLSVLAAACTGGRNATASVDAAGTSLAPRTGTLGFDEMQHFLVRTAFGSTRADLEAFEKLGLEAWLDRVLSFAKDSALERSAAKEIENPERPRQGEVVRWWAHLMARTRNPFQESLALFWHDHFGVSQAVLGEGRTHMMLDHLKLLRRLGNGNLRELLYRVATDPAMLVFLDGVASTKEKPNENFAREFWELFSLGVDNGYTQADVEEASRAFTGYRLRFDSIARQSFVTWDELRHDDGPKTVFGLTGNYGYRELVDLTIDQRPVAEFICRKLFEHFCYEDPPGRVVDEMARFFREADYELRPLLRMLLRSEAFFSKRSRESLLKGPVDFIVGFMRTTGLELPFYELDEGLAQAGQRPTQPPNVAGWPGGMAWLGSAFMLERGNLANALMTAREHQFRLSLSLSPVLPPPGERDAERVLGEAARLLRVRISESETDRYLAYLNTA
ncbi:MAG: DUF1800 family protein, partial [Planctomycetota bacterium]